MLHVVAQFGQVHADYTLIHPAAAAAAACLLVGWIAISHASVAAVR
jgi:hypothetical protein